MGWSNVINAL